jgi:hypothetical protein
MIIKSTNNFWTITILNHNSGTNHLLFVHQKVVCNVKNVVHQ